MLWTVAAGVLGHPSDAEDVLQEACVMALDKRSAYQRGTNFTAWMASYVRNVALNHARKRQRRATTPTAPEVLRELPLSSSAAVDLPLPIDARGQLTGEQHAFDDRMKAGLETLSVTQRSCLLMRTVLELSYREIASALDIPEGTAMSHVHRARTALRSYLENEPATNPLAANRVEEQ